jgi:hypothetical protein
MADDIVERLRDRSVFDNFDLMEEAADEIERLRKALKPATQFIQDVFTNCILHGCDYADGIAQEKMEELGIIKKVIQHGPCGLDCNCVDIFEGPTYECYRLVPEIAARTALEEK